MLKTLYAINTFLILALGIIHISLTPLLPGRFYQGTFWFISGGMMAIFMSFLNLIFIRDSGNGRTVQALCHIANLMGLMFATAMAAFDWFSVALDPFSYIVFLLFVFESVAAFRFRPVFPDLISLIKTISPFSWTIRLLLGVVAIAGTVVYAMSFALVEDNYQLIPIAIAIGFASGISWLGFGAILLLITRCRPGILAWADACLIAMSVGIAVLMMSALSNVLTSVFFKVASAPAIIHIAILIVADALMAIVFVRRAHTLGLKRAHAVLLWVVALNGIFTAVLILWSRFGGIAL